MGADPLNLKDHSLYNQTAPNRRLLASQPRSVQSGQFVAPFIIRMPGMSPDPLAREASQSRQDVGNAVWRTRVHKGTSPQQFWFLEFCFPLFLVDGIATPPLLPLKSAGQRVVC